MCKPYENSEYFTSRNYPQYAIGFYPREYIELPSYKSNTPGKRRKSIEQSNILHQMHSKSNVTSLLGNWPIQAPGAATTCLEAAIMLLPIVIIDQTGSHVTFRIHLIHIIIHVHTNHVPWTRPAQHSLRQVGDTFQNQAHHLLPVCVGSYWRHVAAQSDFSAQVLKA